MGSDLNPRHLVPKEGLTALEAFKALAPGRAVPAALMQMHERLYPAGRTLTVGQSTRAAAGAKPAGERPALDPDLEHNGEFQQSYPAETFLQVMCDFPTGGGSYKHTNRTDPHTDASLDVHTIYFAVGSDIGTITATPCAGKNEGGFFDGDCGSTISVNAGFHNSGLYDAGLECERVGGLFCEIFGCPELCVFAQVRFELQYNRISNDVNFHECARITH